MAKCIVICKADKSIYGPEISDVTIEISAKVPSFSYQTNASAYEAFYLSEARKVEEALHDTVPGGIYERIAGLMLQRLAGILGVPFGGGREAGNGST
ncbi:MAG TPA: hypothetical protein PLJ35_22245 [Anaerolineae bacterium]|nr:hypothetical protein [Anaerolineae bacterium]